MKTTETLPTRAGHFGVYAEPIPIDRSGELAELETVQAALRTELACNRENVRNLAADIRSALNVRATCIRLGMPLDSADPIAEYRGDYVRIPR